ncbi:MAG: hypothetical protein LBG67_04050 [Campylobacteraceae bacterium]|jgi:hypothetical protein|nr:hypothetical protein [Campylobacteraceae bacterium]
MKAKIYEIIDFEDGIAKNLNRFRKGEPTEEFWEIWKVCKEELKALKFSVFKDKDNKFYVYDWDCGTATAEEYEAWVEECKADNLNGCKSSFLSMVWGNDRFTQDKKSDIDAEVERCGNVEDVLSIIRREMFGSDVLIKEYFSCYQ